MGYPGSPAEPGYSFHERLVLMNSSRRKLLADTLRLLAGLGASSSGILSPRRLFSQTAAPHAMSGMAKPATPASPAKPPRPWLQPASLTPFVDPLPIPRSLLPTEKRAHPHRPGEMVDYLRLDMKAANLRVHRDLPPTSMWTYNGTVPGPTIEVRSGRPLLVDWVNQLPDQHFLPIDHTLCGAGADLPQVRTAVHVHGAVVPPESDGFPEDWKTQGQTYRAFYPLPQDAATLWYHDHAMGIERLNQYAGLFGFFLVRDEAEQALALPSGPYEIPLVICDRLFYADGQLHYPESGDPTAPWVPEIYGDVVMVNGTLFPFLQVEPRAYRFRVLNASNTRVFRFSLSNSMPFTQIGSDQGLLPAPVQLQELVLAPAERADIVLDFSAQPGQQFAIVNQGQALMQFRVAPRPVALKTASEAAAPNSTLPAFSVPKRLRAIERIPSTAAVLERTLTLNEYMHPKTQAMLMLLNGKYWHDPVTENPRLNSIEIWNLVNTTQDVHPIHLHLVKFQVLERRAFDVDDFLNYGKFEYLGEPAPPEPGETGWKDTVQAHPETVTRIIIPFRGYPGRYVWHCHLLEHAANEMMRPFEVLPA